MLSKFQFVVRRSLLAFVAVVTWGLLASGMASAAQTFSITNSSGGHDFPANKNVPYTTTMNFDSGHGAAQRALITTSPGVLAALSANPSCIQGTPQYTTACQLGQGTANIEGIPGAVSLTGYLVPAKDPAHDVAGVDLIAGQGSPTQSTTHAEIQLAQNSSGNVSAVLNVDLAGAGAASSFVTGSSLTVSDKLNDKPFTRMPSNCNPGPSSLVVTYADGTTETSNASPDFNITGCSSLAFSPRVTVSAIKDARDPGVEVITTETQTADEAAGLSNTLALPWPAIAPNSAALSFQNNFNEPVGSVVSTSPLQPAPLKGLAYLTGSTPFTPTLTLKFPAPTALTLVGTVNLDAHTVTFTNLPDVPQTSLVVTLFGGPKAAEAATCAPPTGIVHASFTGQNGKAISVSQPLTVSGCPTAPSIRGASFSGLGSGRPSLRFRLARGSDAPNLRSVTISLPAGLSVNRKRLGRGISVSAPHTLRVSGRQLTIRLKQPVAGFSVRIAPSALLETKQLRRASKRRASVAQVTVNDALGASSSYAITSR